MNIQSPLPFILTDTSVTIVIGGKPNVVADTHPNFGKIVEAIRNAQWSSIDDLIDIPAAVQRYAQGTLEVWDNEVRFQGQTLQNAAVDRLLSMMAKGFNIAPLINFLHRVVNNPDPRAVNGLYSWLEKGNLPLTEDGCIIAYKLVRDDYFDHFSGEFDHTPGNIVEQARFRCDPDPDRTCSSGLHFCSAEYLPHYGSRDSRVVLVKIDPADVVAFPHDYNISKGRCCRYEVVQEIDRETAASFFGDTPVFNTDADTGQDEGMDFNFTLEIVEDCAEIYDEDDELVFIVDASGIRATTFWFSGLTPTTAPYSIGDMSFDPNYLSLLGDELQYDGETFLTFESKTEASLIGGLSTDDVPFPITANDGLVRVRI